MRLKKTTDAYAVEDTISYKLEENGFCPNLINLFRGGLGENSSFFRCLQKVCKLTIFYSKLEFILQFFSFPFLYINVGPFLSSLK